MPKSAPLLLTGAAGVLGQWLRPYLAKRPEGLRSSDLRDFGPVLPNEAIAAGNLADAAFVDRLVAGASSIVHLGGIDYRVSGRTTASRCHG